MKSSLPLEAAGKLTLGRIAELISERTSFAFETTLSGRGHLKLLTDAKAAGLELTPDVWERLAADRRQALEDDLAWMHP